MNYEIPENEQYNFIFVFWQMLAEIEGRTDPEKDILDKHLVEGAYTLLNRSNIIQEKPRWLRNK